MILRGTVKFLKLLGVRPASLEPAEASEHDWYGNLLWIERRKCVLFTHAGTLFSFFVPDVRKRDLVPLELLFFDHLETALRAEHLRPDTFAPRETTSIRLAKTADRRVLGCMNDLAFICEHGIHGDGGLERTDIAGLNHHLRRIIHSTTDYTRPIQQVRALAGIRAIN